MENCLIIINKSAGTSDKISFDFVKKRLGNGYKYYCHTIPTDGEPNLDEYGALAVCGGDGTLSNVLNKVYDKPKDVFYFPSGTLNDKAKAGKRRDRKALTIDENHAVVGIVKDSGETVFSYVFAAGSFTPIGYETSVKKKKEFGVLAYLSEVVKEYKIHRIPLTVDADGKRFEGDFTLVMLLKSPRCFGFNFNKAYDSNKETGHLILIRSPKHDGLLGKIEMFFPFFKVFFLGLKKERDGNVVFKEFECADMVLKDETVFCKDGEKSIKQGEFHVCFKKSECSLNLMRKN
ncbi:MAG: hypothetical protein IK048_02395 [Clostridia bacterium]|nr:hypothetical protein [Clostridia bacterium]